MSLSWIRVAVAEDCPPGKSLELVVDGNIVALFNVDGDFFAIDGVCPHQGGPLAKGILAGCIVTCPWHGWQFDVRDGQHQLNARFKHPCFPVRLEDGNVFVGVQSESG